MRMTLEQFNAHQARHAPKQCVAKSGCEKESELHAQIFDECRRRGWIALHGAMSERTHRTAGEPDFTILTNTQVEIDMKAADGTSYSIIRFLLPKRVLFVECKTRTGKLSPAQTAMIHHAKTLGHTIHVVRSFDEFLKLL